MVNVKMKTVVGMKMSAEGVSHARTNVSVRDVSSVIDEPVERGGTNQGLTPTETLIASLMGCTNVITQRVAEHMDVKIGTMTVNATADFDRRGVMMQEEIEKPFDNVVLTIDMQTNASAEQMEKIKADLRAYCPIAKVIRNAGASIEEVWNLSAL